MPKDFIYLIPRVIWKRFPYLPEEGAFVANIVNKGDLVSYGWFGILKAFKTADKTIKNIDGYCYHKIVGEMLNAKKFHTFKHEEYENIEADFCGEIIDIDKKIFVKELLEQSELSEREKLVLKLHYLWQLTFKEISKELNIRISSVNRIVRRAIIKIQDKNKECAPGAEEPKLDTSANTGSMPCQQLALEM